MSLGLYEKIVMSLIPACFHKMIMDFGVVTIQESFSMLFPSPQGILDTIELHDVSLVAASGTCPAVQSFDVLLFQQWVQNRFPYIFPAL